MKNKFKKALALLLALTAVSSGYNCALADELLMYNKETQSAEPSTKSLDELEASPDQYELINGVWYDKHELTDAELESFRAESAKDSQTDDEPNDWESLGWGTGDDSDDGNSQGEETSEDGTEVLGAFEEAMLLCVGMGIMSTDSDGLYLPNELFTHDDLNMMIEKTVPVSRENIVGFSIGSGDQITPRMLADYYVCLLGYQAYSGKQTSSVRSKLLSGIKGKETEAVTRKDAAQIIYNALNTETIRMDIVDGKAGILKGNKLFDELDMVKIDGLLNATEFANYLTNEEVNEGYIQIGRAAYKVDSKVWNKNLGYYVTGYAKEVNDELTIISVVRNEKKSDNSVMKLDTGDLTKNGENKLTYEGEDKKNKTYTIDNNAVVIVNGEYQASVSKFKYNLEDYDNLSLINTDNDSDYDIIALDKYELVDCALITDSVIAAADNSTIDIKDLKTYFEFNGANADLKAIKCPSVAKVKKNSYAVEVYFSNVTVEGTLRGIGKDSIKLADDDTVYTLDKNAKIRAAVGVDCVVRLTHDGKVGFVDNESGAGLTATGRNYAYMRKVIVDESEEKVLLRLYLLDGAGTWATMPLTEKVYLVDGANAPSNQDGAVKRTKLNAFDKHAVFENLEPQLITYEKNSDGEISEIGTARDLVGKGEVDENNFAKNGELRVFRKWSETFLGKNNNYVYDKKTIFLTVPFDRTLEDSYKLTPTSDNFVGDRAEVYDVNDAMSIQGVVVKYTSEKPILTISKERWAILITDIDHTVNDDDEEIIKIDDIHHKKYYFDDPYADIATTSDIEITQSVYGNTVKKPIDLKVGDVLITEFEVMPDGSRRITVFALVLRTSEMEVNCPDGYIDTESYGWLVRYGKVIRSNSSEGHIVANCSGTGNNKSLNKPLYRKDNIWDFDIKHDKLTKVGPDSVKPGDSFVSVVRTWSGAPIFIILNDE